MLIHIGIMFSKPTNKLIFVTEVCRELLRDPTCLVCKALLPALSLVQTDSVDRDMFQLHVVWEKWRC